MSIRGRASLLVGLLVAGGVTHVQHAAAAPPDPPLGGLMVAPTRVVFEGRRRSAELVLINTGAETATYRIGFVQMRLTESGALQEIAEPGPGEAFADPFVRYSPRQVVLEPRVPQTVRLQIRKPPALTAGEYRSHLAFRAVPRETPAAREGGGMRVALTAVYGVAVPVIVRQGATSATVTLTDLQLRSAPGGGGMLQFQIRRAGTRSVYGDLTATFVPARGRALIVGAMRGLAVYTPNAVRRVEMALKPPQGSTLRNGRLRLEFASAEDPDRRGDPLASAEILVP